MSGGRRSDSRKRGCHESCITDRMHCSTGRQKRNWRLTQPPASLERLAQRSTRPSPRPFSQVMPRTRLDRYPCDFAGRIHCVCGLGTFASKRICGIVDYPSGACGRYHCLTAIPVHGHVSVQLGCTCVSQATRYGGPSIVDLGMAASAWPLALKRVMGQHSYGCSPAQDENPPPATPARVKPRSP